MRFEKRKLTLICSVSLFKVSLVMLALFMGLSAMAQTRTVTGTVTDASDGSTLPGVNIQVKGTDEGVVSDENGGYTISVGDNAVLVFNFVGYATQEIPVGAQAKVDVALSMDTEGLDEVVVVGYGVQKKKLVTGATSQVKGEDLQKLNTISATDALKSTISGVQITKASGQPGSGFRINIRGMGTIGDASPLFIVDGVAMENADFLNPSDIESFDVLKDAASAAIYGSRAANGVVLITTKSGKFNKKATFSYDGYYGVQNVYKTIPTLNAKEYSVIMNEAAVNDGGLPFDFSKEVPNYAEVLKNGGTNWLEEMTVKNAPIQNHSFSVDGGTDRSNYSIGFSYTNQEGVLGDPVASSYERYTARVNTEHVVFKYNGLDLLKVGEKITYSYSENSGIAIGDQYSNSIRNAVTANPFMPLHDADGNYHPAIDWQKSTPNPIGILEYEDGTNVNKSHTLVANAYVILNPIKNLVFKSSFGYNVGFGSYRAYTPAYKLSTEDEAFDNEVQQSMYMGYGYTFENTLNYTFDIDKSNFNVLIGNTIQKDNIGETINGTNVKSQFEGLEYAYLSNAQNIVVGKTILGGSPYGESSLLSYFGRVNYDYDEKYMLTLVMRADASSNFAKGNRWGYFPSVAAGWLLSEESFMSSTKDYLDYFKLRASWGQNGNQSISPFQYLSTIAFSAKTYTTDKSTALVGAYPNILANEDVTWETSEQLNFGFDAKVLNSRLGINFDWYKKTTKDWLVVAPMLASVGTGVPYINGGEIENTGYEVSLKWRDNIGDLSYNIGANLSRNKNEVTKIANEEKIIHGPADVLAQGTKELFKAQVGYPIGYFRGYKTAGIFQNEAEVAAHVNKDGKVIQPNATPGDVRYVDQNGDGKISDDDKVEIGDPNPDFTFGLNIGLQYKGFDFSASANGVVGNQIAKSYRSFIDLPRQNYTTDILNRWHGEGTSNTHPKVSLKQNDNQFVSDRFIEDGDYLRISNISFGYDFKTILKNIPVTKFRLYVSVQNLYTFTDYSGMDPEIGYNGGENFGSGIDLGYYPSPRTVMFGMNIQF